MRFRPSNVTASITAFFASRPLILFIWTGSGPSLSVKARMLSSVPMTIAMNLWLPDSGSPDTSIPATILSIHLRGIGTHI